MLHYPGDYLLSAGELRLAYNPENPGVDRADGDLEDVSDLFGRFPCDVHTSDVAFSRGKQD